jgi:hypothetical protein
VVRYIFSIRGSAVRAHIQTRVITSPFSCVRAGVESVKVSAEAGLVAVEGTADAATLVERLEARVAGQPVTTVVSDGSVKGEVGTSGAADQASSLPEQEATAPAPIVLEMDLHCDTCAKKVEN